MGEMIKVWLRRDCSYEIRIRLSLDVAMGS